MAIVAKNRTQELFRVECAFEPNEVVRGRTKKGHDYVIVPQRSGPNVFAFGDVAKVVLKDGQVNGMGCTFNGVIRVVEVTDFDTGETVRSPWDEKFATFTKDDTLRALPSGGARRRRKTSPMTDGILSAMAEPEPETGAAAAVPIPAAPVAYAAMLSTIGGIVEEATAKPTASLAVAKPTATQELSSANWALMSWLIGLLRCIVEFLGAPFRALDRAFFHDFDPGTILIEDAGDAKALPEPCPEPALDPRAIAVIARGETVLAIDPGVTDASGQPLEILIRTHTPRIARQHAEIVAGGMAGDRAETMFAEAIALIGRSVEEAASAIARTQVQELGTELAFLKSRRGTQSSLTAIH
jgi:hypothetical protein